MADSIAGSFGCKVNASFHGCKPVPWLKEYLKQRGIQISGKRKVELVELCEKRKGRALFRLQNRVKNEGIQFQQGS